MKKPKYLLQIITISFIVLMFQEIIMGDATATQLDNSPTQFFLPQHLEQPDWLKQATPDQKTLYLDWLLRVRSEDKILHLDVDHTFLERGVKLNPEDRTFDPSQYFDENGRSIELENIDLILINALFGTAVSIETGKDASVWPLATYMRKRLEYLAEEFGMSETYKDGRLKTIDKTKPVIVTFTTGNGGYSIDLLATDEKSSGVFVYKPIPLSGWEGLQREEALLRDSTAKQRIGKIAERELLPGIIAPRLPPREAYDTSKDPFLRDRYPVTNQTHQPKYEPITRIDQLQREIEPELTEVELRHRMALQASIRDIAVHTPLSTKANLVMDLNKIIHDPALNERWKSKTGITITDQDSLFAAFNILAKDWNVTIFRALANGITYVDISGPFIDKKSSGRLAKNYVQGLYRLYDNEMGIDKKRKVSTLTYGDQPTPTTNDHPMLASGGGATNSITYIMKDEETEYPLRLAEIYEEADGMSITNRFFRDLFTIRFSVESVKQTENIFQELEQNRRELYYKEPEKNLSK